MDKVEAFVLIGGRSSRLGTDKAFLELGGRTLAERAVENIRRGLSPERITMVAGSSTQFAIQAIATDVPFIFDLYEGRGPLGGIHAALAYARTQWIFVLACDYPFISPEVIASMAGKLSDEFGAVAPRQSDGRLQPLCAFYNVEKSCPVIGQILESGRVSPPMHEIVMSLSPLIIGSGDYPNESGAQDPFMNVNNTEDLESAMRGNSNSLKADD
jgi:molybdopterin-guanine dinucleotide biosynthesis protein A